MHTSELINSVEAATRLGVDRFAFLRMVKRGDIKPALRSSGLRGAMFFAPGDVEALREKAQQSS